MKHIAVYLAGTIKKGHERADETYWTDEDMRFLREQLGGYEVSFLNPAWRTDDLSDQKSVFGRDMTQVFCSDVVFVDARGRRGLGVGAEMMWAKLNRIPVVTWAPKDTHYHRSQASVLGKSVNDWVHPFVESLSDAVVENLLEGAIWIKGFKSGSARGIEYIESAMEYYQENQLQKDRPMQELLEGNPKLAFKLKRQRTGVSGSV